MRLSQSALLIAVLLAVCQIATAQEAMRTAIDGKALADGEYFLSGAGFYSMSLGHRCLTDILYLIFTQLYLLLPWMSVNIFNNIHYMP